MLEVSPRLKVTWAIAPLLKEINQINDSLTHHFYEGYIKALFRCPGSCNEQIIISKCIE